MKEATFTNSMKMHLEGVRQQDGRAAYLLSCEMRNMKFHDIAVQNHCYKGAKWGNSNAQLELGVLGLFNQLIDVDISTYDDIHYCPSEVALEWLKKSSEANNRIATYLYAKCLQNGICTEANTKVADKMIERAIEHLTTEEIIMLNSIIDYVRQGYSPLDVIINHHNIIMFPKYFKIFDTNAIIASRKKAS